MPVTNCTPNPRTFYSEAGSRIKLDFVIVGCGLGLWDFHDVICITLTLSPSQGLQVERGPLEEDMLTSYLENVTVLER